MNAKSLEVGMGSPFNSFEHEQARIVWGAEPANHDLDSFPDAPAVVTAIAQAASSEKRDSDTSTQ